MNARRRWTIVRIIITTASLMAGWLLFTWSFDIGSIVAGAAASLVVALATYTIFVDETEAALRAHLPRVHVLLLFLIVLIFQMYVASFRMLWQIVRGRINPGIVHFRTRLRTDVARVALCSSITLTPGTVTVLLDDDHLIVHWLDVRTKHSRYAGELIKGTFEKLLGRVWH